MMEEGEGQQGDDAANQHDDSHAQEFHHVPIRTHAVPVARSYVVGG